MNEETRNAKANETTSTATIKKSTNPPLEELIPNIPNILNEADKFDITGLRRFLSSNPERPLIVIGSGSTTPHKYAALLYSSFNAIGTAMTPLMANSLSDETIKHSKILIISDAGSDIDVRYITQRVLSINPAGVALITSSLEKRTRFNKIKQNYALKMTKEKAPENCFTHNVNFHDGFIAVNSTIHHLAIIERAFFNNKIASKLTIPQKAYKFTLNDSTVEDYELPQLDKIKNLIVLHGDLGQPVAYDIESKLTEGGLMVCQICDFRNYCHGRFIYPSNHVQNSKDKSTPSDTAIILLVTPREKNLIKQLREMAIPKQMPIILVESNFDTPLATIDLEIRATILCSEISKAYGVNLNNPQNLASINKFKPKTEVKFEKDFKDYGCLKNKWY